MLGVCVAGLISVALAALKLTVLDEWSWWRVLLPLIVFVGSQPLLRCGRADLVGSYG